MSINQFARNLNRIAKNLRETDRVLAEAGGMVADEIKGNIDKGQNAGSFRVDDAGTIPMEPMQRPSNYTLKRRNDDGVLSEAPLKATGAMYRSIGVQKLSKGRVVVGAKSGKQAKKLYAQLGTDYTGIESSDLGRTIPPRNPVGYTQATRQKIMDVFMRAFGVRDRTLARIDIKLRHK